MAAGHRRHNICYRCFVPWLVCVWSSGGLVNKKALAIEQLTNANFLKIAGVLTGYFLLNQDKWVFLGNTGLIDLLSPLNGEQPVYNKFEK